MSDSNTSNAAIPTAAQLSESRLKQWHQQGEALLTIENLRSWINAAGLVLFAPKPQIVSPAPSLVEAVLGEPNAAPTPAQTTEARSLLARLVAEGMAVPLNLLGVASGSIGDAPDFVCSTAVFSYVFTLRGDKAWKQPPATSGALKVSPLALATHEAIAKRGPISAYDLTTELGKEVTEAAVLRALGELWTHLRVLPLAQPEGGATLWELASTRFVKQIKAGANAGQPSALSALISLYLGQAIVASEEEIESFLSPLAARSRIRDVIHALLPARQLETIAVEGRTMLHVAGELPAFLAPTVAETTDDEAAPSTSESNSNAEAAAVDGEDAPRITKYVPKPKKIGTGYLAKASPSKFASKSLGTKPFGAKTFGSKPAFKSRPAFGAGPAPDRERRPFSKPGAGGFDKPWEEEKARRLAAASKPSEVGGDAGEFAASGGEEAALPRTPRPYTPREGGSNRGGRPSFGSRPSFGRKPAFGGKPSFGSRPSFSSGDRPPRREFTPRTDGDSGPRKTFSKPGTFGRKREGFGGKPSFGGRPSFGGEVRPPRREVGPRTDGGDRPSFSGPRSGPRAPGSFAPRPFPPRTGGDRPQRPEGGAFAPRKPYPPRGAGFFSASPRPADGKPRERQERGETTESGKRVYRKFDAPRDRPDRGYRPAKPYSSDRPGRPDGGGYKGKSAGGLGDRKPAGRPGGFSGKPGGEFVPRRPSGKPGGEFGAKRPGGAGGGFQGKPGGGFASRPGSTFAKFAGNAKPFGNRPPARKYKPKEPRGDE